MISGIILASGFSTRMKQDKLLLPIEGVPMVLRVAREMHKSQVEECVLVYRKEEVRQTVSACITRVVYNPAASLGQSEAIKVGLKNICRNSQCCLFFMGDQPYIKASVIDEIISAWKNEPCKIIVPLYHGKKSSPVLFPKNYYHSLMDIQGDHGGKAVLKKYPDQIRYIEINDPKAGLDADTPTEYKKLIGEQKDEDDHH